MRIIRSIMGRDKNHPWICVKTKKTRQQKLEKHETLQNKWVERSIKEILNNRRPNKARVVSLKPRKG